jgi:chloride channel protein, CIC family
MTTKVLLRDFSADSRMVKLSLVGAVLGVASAGLAWVLLTLIALCTNIFYLQRWSFQAVAPRDTHLGLWAAIVPVVGGLLVGLMARFGSDKIRGHGIPEALEAILLKGAKVDGRVAVLKPISSAISIGSGGPFGAEGPIIMTGGAVGSLVAQFMHLTDAERTTLLVAGAAGGMSATFAAPIAAVLLAVELLLFEWKPRSLVPVAVASAVAALMRIPLLGPGPLFPLAAHGAWLGYGNFLFIPVLGLVIGLAAALLSNMVYTFEDLFPHTKLHWMWWPALGGIVVGLGGLVFPSALGVGYDVIAKLAHGDFTWNFILGIILVKSVIWSFSLGSGTSGGVLAPVLMIGGAIGSLIAHSLHLHGSGTGTWAVLAMSAMLSGALGAPLTSTLFAFELTHDISLLLPLLLVCVVSHGVTALLMPRSILTERLGRRGYHLSREYSVDPLETIIVEAVMRTDFTPIAENELGDRLRSLTAAKEQLFPVLDESGKLTGVLTREDLPAGPPSRPVITAHAQETLRAVAERMATTGRSKLPVLDVNSKVVGIISIRDLLVARVRSNAREQKLTPGRKILVRKLTPSEEVRPL